MRVLCCLVDVSICRSFCESTTRILYPTSSKIPRPNISYFDDNWSIYRGLAVSHKVHGDCHCLRSGCRLGSIQEQQETRKKVVVHEPERQKKSYTTEPKFLYFGTPVALVSSLNEHGSTDLAPISVILGAGMDFDSRIAHRDENRGQPCAPPRMRGQFAKSRNVAERPKKLTPLTGKNPVPKLKSEQLRFEPRKFAAAELTPLASEVVRPARAKECPPVHMEARVTNPANWSPLIYNFPY
jgi:hypothetical protein